MTVATASDVSSLRQKTGFPMMDCKKALADAGGDFEKAKDLLRERLGVSSITPQSNIEGCIAVGVRNKEGDRAYSVVEISTQTDFAANSEEVRAVAGTLAANLLLDIDGSRNDLLLADLRAKTGESVHLRTFVLSKIFDDPSVRISSYVHHDRKTASVVVFSHAESLKEEVMKQIAMHVAGAQPEPLVVSPENLLDSQISKEREFREKAAAESGKPADIQKKMVEGALNKYKASLALTKQQFILDPTKTVEQVLGEKAKIVDFLKIKVGIAT